MFAASLILLTFGFMEFMAWFSHKYIMHGFLWILHKDHHKRENANSFFERNDTFFLIFAIPSMLLFISFGIFQISALLYIAIGISTYGVAYFLVHDVFIHQRIKWLRTIDNSYFRAIRRAHKVHHKHLGKEDGECFGMLWVPRRFFKQIKKETFTN